MAEPTELVQAVKRESTAGGGDSSDDVDYFQPLNDFEDVLSATGLALQEPGDSPPRVQTVKIWRDGGILKFKDSSQGEVTLQTLATNGGGGSSDVWVGRFLLMGG